MDEPDALPVLVWVPRQFVEPMGSGIQRSARGAGLGQAGQKDSGPREVWLECCSAAHKAEAGRWGQNKPASLRVLVQTRRSSGVAGEAQSQRPSLREDV